MEAVRAPARSNGPVAPWVVVALGGAAAAAIDLVYACTFWAVRAGLPPARILQSIAAGVLGPAAFSGGGAAAALGLLLHVGIALSVAALYFLAARRARWLTTRPWVYGAAYGVGVYVVMTYVVVPLSAAGGGGSDALWTTLTIGVHAFGIGVPCALAARAALATDSSREHATDFDS